MGRLLTAVIAWHFLISSVAAADIASVNFKAIKDDLREYYFSKPENAELKKEFEAAVQEEKTRMGEMQKKIFGGGNPADLMSHVASGRAASRYEIERSIDANMKKELYLLITGMGLKYELIYDSSSTETIIYSKSQVDDVTTIVKQAIIDLGKKK